MKGLHRFGFVAYAPDEPPVPPAPAPVPAPAPAPAPVTEPARVFTQDDLDRAAGRARDEGRRSASTSIEEALGCSPEDAKKLLDAVKARDAEAMSEAQKAQQKATEDQAAADKVKADGLRLARDANIVLALAAAGVAVEKDATSGALSGRAARIVKLIDVADDADGVTISAAIDALKKDEPALFSAPVTPPSGDPPGPIRPTPGPGDDALAQGRKLAAAQNEGNLPVFDPANPFAKAPAAGA